MNLIIGSLILCACMFGIPLTLGAIEQGANPYTMFIGSTLGSWVVVLIMGATVRWMID